MDGYDLARRLRDALGPDVALIALTGYGAARDVQRATQAGFDHHLIKPVDIPGITSLIETVSSASGAGPDEPRAAAPRRE
jgi:CheY-like chemotaxis protein